MVEGEALDQREVLQGREQLVPGTAVPGLADAAFDDVQAGTAEVFADQWSRDAKPRLPLAPEKFNAAMDRALAALTAA